MTKVAVLKESDGGHPLAFRAVTAGNQAMGRTAGEALDVLPSQLLEGVADTLIIVRSLRPDRFFSAQQRQRLEELTARWRTARDFGDSLTPDEPSELERLIDAEFHAATARTEFPTREFSR